MLLRKEWLLDRSFSSFPKILDQRYLVNDPFVVVSFQILPEESDQIELAIPASSFIAIVSYPALKLLGERNRAAVKVTCVVVVVGFW